jgi:putative addiction module component (TIGR02574 family)
MISLDEIRKLSVEERIQLVEDIWDTIAALPEEVPVTDSQKAELDRRLAVHEQDPRGRPWRDVVEGLSPRP